MLVPLRNILFVGIISISECEVDTMFERGRYLDNCPENCHKCLGKEIFWDSLFTLAQKCGPLCGNESEIQLSEFLNFTTSEVSGN